MKDSLIVISTTLIKLAVSKIGAAWWVKLLLKLIATPLAKWVATKTDSWITSKISTDIKKAIEDALHEVATELTARFSQPKGVGASKANIATVAVSYADRYSRVFSKTKGRSK